MAIDYTRINWKNEPNETTPLSAENLNKMDKAIDDLVTDVNSLEPNPVEVATEGLEKLAYGGTVYEVKGGHKIVNDNGVILAQKDNMKFGGVYSHNSSTMTEVDIVREFNSVSDIENLTGEEAKGFQYLPDGVYDEFTAGDIGFDNSDTSFVGTNVQDVLEEVDSKIDSLEWKYAGTMDMASPPSGAFDWTATESGTDFANAKEVMMLITMAISGIEYPRTTTISLVNGVNSPIGIDVGFSSVGRIYALGTIKNTTQLSFIGASNGGLASKIKIYWK